MRDGNERPDQRIESSRRIAGPGPAAMPDKAPEPRILIMTGDEAILSLMSAALGESSYHFRFARSSREAREHVASASYDLVFLDPSLLDGSGIDILGDLAKARAVTVVLSRERTTANVAELLRLGACDLIAMPLTQASLAERIEGIVAEWRRRACGARYSTHLEEIVTSTRERLLQTMKQVDRLHDLSVEAIVAVLDLRFPETAGHGRRVAENSSLIGEAFGLSTADLRDLRWGAYLHDIGKIAIPDRVLEKSGPLTAEEFRIVKEHPVRGVEILSRIEFLDGAKDAVLFHHERYDGSGYPYGLRRQEIPLAARIVAVTDTMDAMLHERLYRPASTASAVVEYLENCAGSDFDPKVVEKLRQIREKPWFAEPLEES